MIEREREREREREIERERERERGSYYDVGVVLVLAFWDMRIVSSVKFHEILSETKS